MQNEDYTKQKIMRIMKKGNTSKQDFYMLDVDHALRIALYDVEQASKVLDRAEYKHKQYKRIFDYIMKGYTVNEIAKALHTYERKIYRRLDEMVELLHKTLNGGH